MNKKTGSYVKGATILAAAGILSRLLGLFFKVPLYHLVGSYGNGIYGNVTNIYNLLLMVSTVGLPVAISKMVSENVAIKDFRAANNVFKISFLVLVILGALSTAFLFLGGHFIIQFANWPKESIYAIYAVAPAPLIISVCSAYRGFFQGYQIMTPTAISQIMEQIIRVALGVFLCWYGVTIVGNIGAGVGGAVFGATAGGILAAVFLGFLYVMFMRANRKKMQFSSRKKQLTNKAILKRLVKISIPVTLSSAIVSLFALIDSFIYVSRLGVAGINPHLATEMFGDYTNADLLVNVPLVISGTLAVAMIPAISESFMIKDKKEMNKKIEIAIRLVVIVALPSCAGLAILSDGIFDILFRGSFYGPGILKFYAIAIVFLMLSNIFQSVLQAIDRFKVPLYNLGVAIIVRFVCSWILLAIPSVNIKGLAFSSIITYAFLTLANYYSVRRATKIKIKVNQTFIKPLISTAVMILATIAMRNILRLVAGSLITVLFSMVVAVLTYAVMMIATGGITETEILYFPGKRVILPIYNKIRGIQSESKEKK